MREPLPKELVMEAWKARVGYSRERSLTQRACVESATKFNARIARINAMCQNQKKKIEMFVPRLSSPSRWPARNAGSRSLLKTGTGSHPQGDQTTKRCLIWAGEILICQSCNRFQPLNGGLEAALVWYPDKELWRDLRAERRRKKGVGLEETENKDRHVPLRS